MHARIFQPARTAMQSGQAKTKRWILEYIPSESRFVDPLMGWTGSGDMNSQVQLQFDSREEAEDYAKSNGIAYQVFEPKKRSHILRTNGYGDNFAPSRRNAWTH